MQTRQPSLLRGKRYFVRKTSLFLGAAFFAIAVYFLGVFVPSGIAFFTWLLFVAVMAYFAAYVWAVVMWNLVFASLAERLGRARDTTST